MKSRKMLFGFVIAFFMGGMQSVFAQNASNTNDPVPAQVLCCSEAADGTITCTERICPTDIVNSGCCPEQANARGGGKIINTIKLDAEQSKLFKAGKEVEVNGTIVSRKRAKHMRTWEK